MNKYIGIVILKPDIKKEKIDCIQSGIINLLEQKAKVEKIWFLGKRKLDHKIKKYTEGLYLKIEIVAKDNKIENIKEQLKQNQNVIFSMIIKNEDTKKSLLMSAKNKMPFCRSITVKNIEMDRPGKRVYMLINKNIKMPFAESDILVISEDIQKIFQYANKKIEDYIYVKGYYTRNKYKVIKDVENDFKRTWKVEFVLENNLNVGQQLLIQEKYLI